GPARQALEHGVADRSAGGFLGAALVARFGHGGGGGSRAHARGGWRRRPHRREAALQLRRRYPAAGHHRSPDPPARALERSLPGPGPGAGASAGGKHPTPWTQPAVMIRDDETGMRAALREALNAADAGEVPIGCVIVHDGIVIGRGRNQTESLQDATAHAEIV